MYLDEFFDVVFEIDGSYIKANSFVLKNRNEYFEAMFSSRFKESKDAALIQKQGNNEFRLIKVMGVPKIFFNCIIQFLYSDYFYIGEQSIEFFLQLLIFSDYFLIPRLAQICQRRIKPYLTCQNVIPVTLLAHSHNAEELELNCLDFICLNEVQILKSTQWKSFKKLCGNDPNSLYSYLMTQIIKFKSENFVQHAIELYVRENSKVAKQRIRPVPIKNYGDLRKGRNSGCPSQHKGDNTFRTSE